MCKHEGDMLHTQFQNIMPQTFENNAGSVTAMFVRARVGPFRCTDQLIGTVPSVKQTGMHAIPKILGMKSKSSECVDCDPCMNSQPKIVHSTF